MDIRVLDLPPTKTYHSRVAVWVSNGSGEVDMPNGEIVPGLGKLTIRLKKARRWDAAVETDTYAVQEVEPDQPGTRRFAIHNLTDRTVREPYLVTVGGRHDCRCKAGRCRVAEVEDETRGCKHRDSLEALIEDGALEPAGELLNV